jgi:hypothetical protein
MHHPINQIFDLIIFDTFFKLNSQFKVTSFPVGDAESLGMKREGGMGQLFKSMQMNQHAYKKTLLNF